MWQIAKLDIAPSIQFGEGWAGTTLGIKLHTRYIQSHKPSEKTLLHIGKFLEGHVFDNRRELKERELVRSVH